MQTLARDVCSSPDLAMPPPSPATRRLTGLAALLALPACGDPGGPPATLGADGTWAAMFREPLPPEPPPDAAAPVFDPTTIARVRLVMAAEAWQDLRDDPEALRWHEATFYWQDERVARVGVRAFGNGSLIPGKPSLKLSFDRFVDDRRWRGLETLKFDNSKQDPTFLNEYVASGVLRAIGVPTNRTGWATVEVNGDPAGFFVVLESVDDPFLVRWFGDDDGALYSNVPRRFGQGLLPTDRPLDYFDPQDRDTGDGTDLIALAKIVASGSDAELAAAIDLPEFFRMSVTRSVLGAQDAFSADGKNFYLYDDRGRWRILPWDFDYDLSALGVLDALAVDLRAPWTTSRWAYNAITGAPYHDPLLVRTLALGADPDDVVAELLAGPLRWPAIDDRVTAAAALIRDAVLADPLGHGPTFDRHVAELRLFLHARLTQLAGREVADCPAAPPGVLRAADLAFSGTVGWGELEVDGTSTWGPGFINAGDHFCTGVFAHAPSRVTVDVPAGYGALTGRAGVLDWDAGCTNGATFTIRQAGAILWHSGELRRYDPAVPFGPLQVAPGPLELRTDDLGQTDCDSTAWLDLALAPA